MRRKPVPRLTRLPTAITALFVAALASPTCSCGGAVDSRAGWFRGSAEMKVAPSPGRPPAPGPPSGVALALR